MASRTYRHGAGIGAGAPSPYAHPAPSAIARDDDPPLARAYSAYFPTPSPAPAPAPAPARPPAEEPPGDALRYVRSLRFLPRERDPATAPPDLASTAEGGTLGPFRFPAARSVLWDPTPIGDAVHVGSHAHAPALRITPNLARALARRLRDETRSPAASTAGPGEEPPGGVRSAAASFRLAGTLATRDLSLIHI